MKVCPLYPYPAKLRALQAPQRIALQTHDRISEVEIRRHVPQKDEAGEQLAMGLPYGGMVRKDH
jgi:hypothetical protein